MGSLVTRGMWDNGDIPASGSIGGGEWTMCAMVVVWGQGMGYRGVRGTYEARTATRSYVLGWRRRKMRADRYAVCYVNVKFRAVGCGGAAGVLCLCSTYVRVVNARKGGSHYPSLLLYVTISLSSRLCLAIDAHGLYLGPWSWMVTGVGPDILSLRPFLITDHGCIPRIPRKRHRTHNRTYSMNTLGHIRDVYTSYSGPEVQKDLVDYIHSRKKIWFISVYGSAVLTKYAELDSINNSNLPFASSGWRQSHDTLEWAACATTMEAMLAAVEQLYIDMAKKEEEQTGNGPGS